MCQSGLVYGLSRSSLLWLMTTLGDIRMEHYAGGNSRQIRSKRAAIPFSRTEDQNMTSKKGGTHSRWLNMKILLTEVGNKMTSASGNHFQLFVLQECY